MLRAMGVSLKQQRKSAERESRALPFALPEKRVAPAVACATEPYAA
jgi:hypothetical protein